MNRRKNNDGSLFGNDDHLLRASYAYYFLDLITTAVPHVCIAYVLLSLSDARVLEQCIHANGDNDEEWDRAMNSFGRLGR
jgi:hypothetical protein